MTIDVKSNEVVYIVINDIVYYIDDSTGEQVVQMWNKSKDSKVKKLN